MPIIKKHIKIVVNNCIAKYNGDEKIICDSKNKYVADFEFDSEWSSQQVKTAVFAWVENGVARREEVVFNGNTCEFPTIKGTNFVMVGAFAGDLVVTTGALVDCTYSILANQGLPADPTPDVYAQLIELLNAFLAQGGGGGITESKVVEIINENIAGLQPKTDEELETKSKTIVGAINEINEKAGQGGGVVEETDPTVPDWAKQPQKPSYTWEEIKDKPSFDIPPDYELIEKVVIGYSITTAQPADWATNYTAYFTNEGTDRNPVYVKVSDTSAPAWESGKYYSFDGTTKVKFKRTNEPNGDVYRLKKFLLYTNSAQGEQVSGYLSVKTDYKSPENYEYGAQVNINRWNTASANYVLAEGAIENGRLYLRGGNTSGLYSLGISNVGSLIFSGTTWYDKEAKAKYITTIESSDAILPNTEIYIYAIRQGESTSIGGGVSGGNSGGSNDGSGAVYKAYHLEAGETITQDILMEANANRAPEGELEIWSYMPFTISYPKYDYTHIERIYYFKAFYFAQYSGDNVTAYKSRDALVCNQSGKFEYASNGNPNEPFTLTINGDYDSDHERWVYVKYTPSKEIKV